MKSAKGVRRRFLSRVSIASSCVRGEQARTVIFIREHAQALHQQPRTVKKLKQNKHHKKKRLNQLKRRRRSGCYGIPPRCVVCVFACLSPLFSIRDEVVLNKQAFCLSLPSFSTTSKGLILTCKTNDIPVRL
ncbi:Hypothetical protein, putative [Bodo saltans]|uniref:Uncharacterized protein n=1 Tax=Bodo saltans TaxID=75058 RepID=A0A0S4JBB5_BODSA|nr:Hypothetical protein, putative [Bodo saltans]|eukprot:CUG88807.1 Hypothetical protein, putative [Bodo saltans]